MGDAELLDAVRRCQLCSELPLGPRPLLQWSRTARILIAGQAPGLRTHNAGVPFRDPSGDRLREWLGVDPVTFYNPSIFAIVPMAFCFPGNGENGDLPPPARCADTWRSALLTRFSDLRLTIILGRFAAAWHRPTEAGTLTAQVLQWETSLPNSIVLPHPSPRNGLWLKRNPWFETETLPALQKRVREIIRS